MKPPRNRQKKSLALAFWILLILVFSCLSFFSYIQSPIGDNLTVSTVEIPRGASFGKVVNILEETDLLKHKYLFYLLAFSQNAMGRIKAGEYELAGSMSPLEVQRKMLKGQIKGYVVTFPEDITMQQVVDRLATYKLVDEENFMKLASDRDFLDYLGIEGPALEGYLYPDTYTFDRSMGAKGIISMMVRQFWKKVTREMVQQARDLGMTTQEFVTLASMIGKETWNAREKTLISAVFHNRLKKGMKLQSDPTAVYGVADFQGFITRQQIRRETAYNTYYISGLPPGPIGNPGIESLRAALSPADVDYLFFVSKNDGTHFFSNNYPAHSAAVARYQSKKDQLSTANPL